MRIQKSTVPNECETSKTIIKYKEHDFIKATFNGFEILVHKQTEYINATKLCHDVSLKEGKRCKEFYHIRKSPQFIDYVEYIKDGKGPTDFEGRKFLIKPSDFDMIENVVGKGYNNDIKGTYIHPKLINCVLTMTSIKYLKIVSKIMNTINTSIHEQLEKQQLNDTPEHAQPIFNNIVQTFTQQTLEQQNQQCWGVREHDSLDYLSTWDKDVAKTLWANFKHSLKAKLDVSLDELARDYPQLLD